MKRNARRTSSPSSAARRLRARRRALRAGARAWRGARCQGIRRLQRRLRRRHGSRLARREGSWRPHAGRHRAILSNRAPTAGSTKEVRVKTWQERLFELVKRGRGYVACPGGTGTLVELAVVWEMLNKGVMAVKPIVVLGRFLAADHRPRPRSRSRPCLAIEKQRPVSDLRRAFRRRRRHLSRWPPPRGALIPAANRARIVEAVAICPDARSFRGSELQLRRRR